MNLSFHRRRSPQFLLLLLVRQNKDLSLLLLLAKIQ
nr:MAG TPA: hypothetical protein [Caudoviricetes sp.]